jgi:predicted alpha/beta-hydrolase family hydrolase
VADILLGHGASGNAESMKPYVDGLTKRGVKAGTVPAKGKLPNPAERAIPYFLELMDGRSDIALGGHSYGGRVASIIASRQKVAGLVLFSYPFHRPGRPDEQRTDHWPAIKCPVLMLSGEADPFARIEIFREVVARWKNFELVTFPGVGHGLHRNKAAFDDALDRAAGFLKRL